MQFATNRYPHLETSLRDLARRHGELEDESLHLALVYDPGRDPEDVFLFELIGNFGRDEVGEDGDLWEVSFGPTDTLPMSANQRLHLILTNPNELRFALAASWPTAIELRDAVRRGDFEVLHTDETGRDALGWLR